MGVCSGISSTGKETLQSEQFRIYKAIHEKRQGLKSDDEIFEDQLLLFLRLPAKEEVKNREKRDKRNNKLKQFWTFVEQHFDTRQSHDHLRKHGHGYQRGLRNRDAGHIAPAHMPLDTIDESQSEISYLEDSRFEDDPLNSDEETKAPANHKGTSRREQLMRNMPGRSGESAQALSRQATATMAREVRVPTFEEIKEDLPTFYKSVYVDSIERVFSHLRGVLNEPNLVNDRMGAYLQQAHVLERQYGESSRPNAAPAINLEELFKNVLEDDRTQPDQSMQLQLDAFLIKRYFNKLARPMQENLLDLLSKRQAYVHKMMQLNLERTVARLAAILKSICQAREKSQRRNLFFKEVLRKLHVNKFINRRWNASVTIEKSEIMEMITVFYCQVNRVSRGLAHQSELLEQRRPVQSMDLVEPDLARQSFPTALTDATDELFSTDKRGSFSLTALIGAEKKTYLTSLDMLDQRVVMDISLLSSNLLFIFAIKSEHFVKKQIAKTDLLRLATMASNHQQGLFLLQDVFLLYIKCVERIFSQKNTQRTSATLSDTESALESQAADLFKDVSDTQLFHQLVCRVWLNVADDEALRARDQMISAFFASEASPAQATVTDDFDAIDFSDSSDDEATDGLGNSNSKSHKSASSELLLEVGIKPLVRVCYTSEIELKATLVHESIENAVACIEEASSTKATSEAEQGELRDQLAEQIVRGAYREDPQIALHLNLTFIMSFLPSGNFRFANSRRVARVLGQTLLHAQDRARQSSAV